jgi:hypothetical protein
MRIGLIIAEFESSFGSSFQHTARVQFDVDFESSKIQVIFDNLNLLEQKILLGECNGRMVGWQMSLDHVRMLQHLLNQILCKFEELFHNKPMNQKIYSVNHKLRETELSSPKEFALDAIKSLFVPVKENKLSKKEQQRLQAESVSRSRAFKAYQKIQLKHDQKPLE